MPEDGVRNHRDKFMSKHYIIFIHGMGEGRVKENYEQLWRRLGQAAKISPEEFAAQFQPIFTEWHVGQLSQAANIIYDDAFPGLKNQPFNPMRGIRYFVTFFLGDVAAYVSEDVNFIRRLVWQQIWDQLEQPLKQEEAIYSIVAYSLGTAIAFDYLYSLFKKDELFVPLPDPQERPEDLGLTPVAGASSEECQLLQERFRHFFTLGSPIGLFTLRKGSLWMRTQPFNQLYNPVRGQNRVWLNFWDSEDPIAYPLAQLFSRNPENQGANLVDVPVETGFLLLDSHTRYWENRQVAAEIARVLQQS